MRAQCPITTVFGHCPLVSHGSPSSTHSFGVSQPMPVHVSRRPHSSKCHLGWTGQPRWRWWLADDWYGHCIYIGPGTRGPQIKTCWIKISFIEAPGDNTQNRVDSSRPQTYFVAQHEEGEPTKVQTSIEIKAALEKQMWAKTHLK